MKTAELGALLLYDGRLVRVVAFSEGRMLLLQPVEQGRCPTCGSTGQIHVLESSRLFQERAEPVVTLGPYPATEVPPGVVSSGGG